MKTQDFEFEFLARLAYCGGHIVLVLAVLSVSAKRGTRRANAKDRLTPENRVSYVLSIFDNN